MRGGDKIILGSRRKEIRFTRQKVRRRKWKMLALKAFGCSCLKLLYAPIYGFEKSARTNRAIGLQFLLFPFCSLHLSIYRAEINNIQSY